MPQPSEGAVVSPGRPSFTWGAASFAFVLKSFTIADDRSVRVSRDRRGGRVRRSNGGMANTRFPYPRNHQGPAAVRRLLNNSCGVLRRSGTVEIHRSAHSTNAGGLSLRMIVPRKTPSSWRSVAVAPRAASRVA